MGTFEASIIRAMSTDCNRQPLSLPSDSRAIEFPVPPGGEQVQPLEFTPPPEIIVDPYGGLFCIVCQAAVPRSEGNTFQHVSGKRHILNEKRLIGGDSVKKEIIRQRFIEAAETQRAMFRPQSCTPRNINATDASFQNQLTTISSSGSAAAAPAPTASLPINVTHKATSKTPSNMLNITIPINDSGSQASNFEKRLSKKASNSSSESLEENPASSSETRNPSAPVGGPAIKTLKEQRLKFAEEALSESKFDTDDYLQHLLHDDDESASEPDQRDSSNEMDTTYGGYMARRQTETTFEYKAPDGPDFTFDSMAPETTRLDFAGYVLRSSVPTKRGTEGTLLTGADFELDGDGLKAQFIPMKSKGDDDGSGDRAGQRRKRWITQNNLLVLHDDNGEELPPWLLDPVDTNNVLFSADSSIALHFEILQFEKFVSPTKAEVQARNEVIMTLDSITKKLWSKSSLHVFGSVATNLALPSSDVDITIMGTPKGGTADEFDVLANAVRNISGFAKRVQVIRAKIPLVKIISRSTGMNCDVSIGVENGVNNVSRIKGFLEKYPALRPLLLVVKYFLHQRGLNDVYTGGLGSYAVLLMLVSHLQLAMYNFPKTKANLGAQLQQFFELYGQLWNPCLAGIQIRDGGLYYDKFERFGSAPFEMMRFSIEDPNDVTNEVARNSYSTAKLRTAFQNASKSLIRWRRDDASSSPTPLGTLLFTEHGFLKRRRVVIDDLERLGKCPLREAVGEGCINNLDKVRLAGSHENMFSHAAEVHMAGENGHFGVVQNAPNPRCGNPVRGDFDGGVTVDIGNENSGNALLRDVAPSCGLGPSNESSYPDGQRHSVTAGGGSLMLAESMGPEATRTNAVPIADVCTDYNETNHLDGGVAFPGGSGSRVMSEPVILSGSGTIPVPSTTGQANPVHEFSPEHKFGGAPVYFPNAVSMPVDFPTENFTPLPSMRSGSRDSDSAIRFRGSRNSSRKGLRRGKRVGVRKYRR